MVTGLTINERLQFTGFLQLGDVAGGCPQKYVTGALAEGEIAAQAIAERLEGSGKGFVVNEADSELSENAFAKKSEYERFLNNKQDWLISSRLRKRCRRLWTSTQAA